MLQLSGLAIARGGRTLLRDVDAAFAPGTFTALMGANGVGKTTLLATMCGVLAPAGGAVTLDGADIATLDARTRAQRMALVEPTEPALASMTVADAVSAARFPYHRWWEWQPSDADHAAVDEALAATELTAMRARELGTLSAGERQRVWIALALAQRARIIALDEPTTHLDLRYAIETLTLLRRLAEDGAVVIAVLHTLEEAAGFADRVILVGEERVLADGPPAQAFTQATLSAAYGIAIEVETGDGGLNFRRKTTRPADESAGRE
jgi:ABC-type cobalamin/Fe3+-siderophores transport system ATPase subunit